MTTTTYYRGYALVTDDLGTDVWSGSDYVETTHGPTSLEQAKTDIDSWLDAR